MGEKIDITAEKVSKMFQVKFKSGQGQQVRGSTEKEVRAQMAKTYGEDYAIESIQELK